MDWNVWKGKKVFLRTRKEKFYTGVVRDVEDAGNGIIFLYLVDKFNTIVTLVTTEIVVIREEGERKDGM